MEELREKLVSIFSEMEDKPYLLANGKSWTTKELMSEIKNKTKFGEELVENTLRLTLDLLSRQKIK